MNNIQSYLAKILCLFGCSYHLFEISEIYFSYETSTNVKHDSSNRILANHYINSEVSKARLVLAPPSLTAYNEKRLKNFTKTLVNHYNIYQANQAENQEQN